MYLAENKFKLIVEIIKINIKIENFNNLPTYMYSVRQLIHIKKKKKKKMTIEILLLSYVFFYIDWVWNFYKI